MPAFIVVKKVRKAGAKPTRFERERLRVGRAGENDVVLDDPLVSPAHCEIEWIGGQFRLSDKASVTGTFVDGKPIDAYFTLASGQRLVVGLNQIDITIDAAKQECTAALTEGIGTGEKTLHRVAYLTRRPWWLRPKIHMLCGLAVALLPVAGLLAAGHAGILENGALARAHEVDARSGRAIGCADCHIPLAGASPEKCGACHEKAVGAASTHPIAARAVARDRKVEGCRVCHAEHRGRDAALVPKTIASSECRACHADSHRQRPPGAGPTPSAGHAPPASAGGGAIAGGLFPQRPPGSIAGGSPPQFPPGAFDAFSHAAHSKAGVSDCATCHAPANAGGGRDFTLMTYEGCVGCHAHESQRVAAHGTNQQCVACHAGPGEKALAVVRKAVAGPVLASFGAQHHDLASRCDACHEGKERDLVSRSSGKPFDHHAHASTLTPTGTADVARVSGQCASCHADMAGASGAAPPAAACARCHTKATITTGALPAGAAATREVVRFSHVQHRATACIACHGFAEDRPLAGPALGASPKDCAACHIREAAAGDARKEYVSAGLGACVYCHRGANDVFDPRPAVHRVGASVAYAHRSQGHASLACNECHADAREAATVSALRVPRMADRECARCHGAGAVASAPGGIAGDLQCVPCHSFHHDTRVAHAPPKTASGH